MKDTVKIKLEKRIRAIKELTDNERSALLGLFKDTKTYGGIIIENSPDCWLYCKLDISNTNDLTGWDMFDPNNA